MTINIDLVYNKLAHTSQRLGFNTRC